MTYGWAILVVLVAISALAYFGVLDMNKFLPATCDLPTGLSCLDHRVTVTGFGQDENTLKLRVKNNLGSTIYIQKATVTDYNVGGFVDKDQTFYHITRLGDPISGIKLTNGESTSTDHVDVTDVTRFTPGAPFLSARDKYITEFTIEYINGETGLTHYAKGYARGKVE